MPTRYIQNKTIYYIYNDNPKLPITIMIHGFRGTHHGMDLIAANLPNFRIIVPDVPGFGESSPLNNQHTINDYVEWLADFINKLKLDKTPILIGHSFGSIITSHFASKHQSMISKLILINPIASPALKGPKAILTKLAILYYWFGRKLPEKIAKKLLSAKLIVLVMSVAMAKTKDKKIRKYIHKQHLDHFSTFSDTKTLSQIFRTSVENTVTDIAANIIVPTLLIAGDIDDITPIKKQYELVKIMPDAKLKVISKVGHLTHYETPKQVAKEIISFC